MGSEEGDGRRLFVSLAAPAHGDFRVAGGRAILFLGGAFAGRQLRRNDANAIIARSDPIVRNGSAGRYAVDSDAQIGDLARQ